MSELNVENESRPKPPTLWQENHGSFLLGFLVAIFLLGASILFYRQSQFIPARFPDGDSIENPEVNSATLSGRETAASESVSITVSGAANDQGTMMVAIYDSKESFNNPDQAVMRQPLTLTDGEATWSIPIDKVPGKMAVAAFHDENGDGELNRNRIGIPSERYGFSNNARGLTGPPAFNEAVVDRPAAGKHVTVYIR